MVVTGGLAVFQIEQTGVNEPITWFSARLPIAEQPRVREERRCFAYGTWD